MELTQQELDFLASLVYFSVAPGSTDLNVSLLADKLHHMGGRRVNVKWHVNGQGNIQLDILEAL